MGWADDPLVQTPVGGDAPAATDTWGNDPLVKTPVSGSDTTPTMTVRPERQGPPQPPMSTLERFGTGLNDPFVGAAQLTMHAVGQGERADAYVRDREAGIAETTPNPDQTRTTLDQQGRASHVNTGKIGGTDPVRAAGAGLSPPNLIAAAAGGIPGAALAGAATGAFSPVTGDDFWKEKAIQTGVGAATGGATGLAGRLFGGAIAPQFRPAAQRLLDAGVELTPGQMAGGVVRRTEEAGKSLPITGTVIRGAELRTIDSFNRATVNRALAPIGIQAPPNLSGTELIAHGQQQLSDAYNALLPNTRFHADPQFTADIANLHTLVQEMPPAQVAQFNAVLQNRVMQRLNPNGTMDGLTLKQVESELSNFASNYRHSSDAAQRQLGDAVRELQAQIRQSLARQNPAMAQRLQDINTAYAMFVRVEDASVRRATSGGRFTPGDLLTAARTGDRSVRHRTFARGDALLQDWANDAQDVIANHMPDSGTTERHLAYDIGMGAGGYAVSPHIPIALGAASVPYTRPGQAALNWWASDQAPWRQAFGRSVEGATTYAAPIVTEETQEKTRRMLGMKPRDSGTDALR